MWPCAGFVIYELGQAMLCAVYQRPPDRSLFGALRYFGLGYVLTTAAAGLTVLCLGLWIEGRGLRYPAQFSSAPLLSCLPLAIYC